MSMILALSLERTENTSGSYQRFPSLHADDEYKNHDVEMVYNNEKKQTDILVCNRAHSSSRLAYKIEKKSRTHLLQGGKKTIDILISRSDAWDSVHSKALVSRSKIGKGCIILFQASNQSPRHLSLFPTKGTALYLTARGGDLTLTPNCASYDPQRSHAIQPRLGSAITSSLAPLCLVSPRQEQSLQH